MPNITIGASGERVLLVTNEVAITFLGVEGGRVLSTPHMIGQMEITCRDLVFPMLDPGEDTVGTRVEVSHLAAAPVGTAVTFRAEILAVDRRRVRFRVEARDNQEKIGEGFHERGIIHIARFVARLAEKKR
jgi:predicted thioesterase